MKLKDVSSPARPAERLSRLTAPAGIAALPILPASAAAIPDPIFAVIVFHRELSADLSAAVDVSAKLEDGPEFEAADAVTSQKNQALIDYAETLIRSMPTTIPGITALMRYVASLEEWQAPVDRRPLTEIAHNSTADWHQVLLSTLADALDKIGHSGSPPAAENDHG